MIIDGFLLGIGAVMAPVALFFILGLIAVVGTIGGQIADAMYPQQRQPWDPKKDEPNDPHRDAWYMPIDR